jgi:hypothetical protein
MKIKSWLKYLIYITIIIFIIVLKEYVQKLFSDAYYRYELGSIFFYVVISSFLGICIGLFLGLEHLFSELGKEGTWKINLPKLIIVGLPSLYISIANIWVFGGSKFLHNIIPYPLINLLRYGSGYVSLFQMILGYVIITSFFKYSDEI